MENNKLYRWYNKNNLKELVCVLKWEIKWISNYTNSLSFSSWYWSIVWEYKILNNIKIIKKDINNRKALIEDYDKIIYSKWIDWYKWLISKKNIYHFRIKNISLKLIKIHYINNDSFSSLASAFFLNRKYLWKTQVELWKIKNINRVKISEYEWWKKTPTIERTLELISDIPINQNIYINDKCLTVPNF